MDHTVTLCPLIGWNGVPCDLRNANAWIPLTNPLLLLSLVCGECTAREEPRNGVGEQERRKKSNPGRDKQGLRLELKVGQS